VQQSENSSRVVNNTERIYIRREFVGLQLRTKYLSETRAYRKNGMLYTYFMGGGGEYQLCSEHGYQKVKGH
jgi:hypothetical protein